MHSTAQTPSASLRDISNHVAMHTFPVHLQDFEKGEVKQFKKACQWYQTVAQRLAGSGHCLDVFACSLDQVGIAEMHEAISSSGEYMVVLCRDQLRAGQSCVEPRCCSTVGSCVYSCAHDQVLDLLTTETCESCSSLWQPRIMSVCILTQWKLVCNSRAVLACSRCASRGSMAS